ncbi:hypothetical protein HAX54_000936 [Datura stramonium]|uniref:Uncharacterized protein n=1 Tax=Datura stramonium TaxID=4076 RepID=A0ABS8T1P6_DATST|nr:hypothetical protein [Datura stramonium]
MKGKEQKLQWWFGLRLLAVFWRCFGGFGFTRWVAQGHFCLACWFRPEVKERGRGKRAAISEDLVVLRRWSVGRGRRGSLKVAVMLLIAEGERRKGFAAPRLKKKRRKEMEEGGGVRRRWWRRNGGRSGNDNGGFSGVVRWSIGVGGVVSHRNKGGGERGEKQMAVFVRGREEGEKEEGCGVAPPGNAAGNNGGSDDKGPI